ncbi:MAG: tetratricopeptide repeat protein [Sphingobacteriales bacterium]|nr:tetratricopeptide repeat protein [Sphingobacteriales bacterium]
MRVLLTILAVFLIINPAVAQTGFTKPYWDAYNKAATPVEKREAYKKLEKIYSRYQVDTAILISEEFIKYAKERDKDYVPFVQLRIGNSYIKKLNLEKASQTLLPVLDEAEKNNNDSLKAAALQTIAYLNKLEKNKALTIKRGGEAAVIHEKLKQWKELGLDYMLVGSMYNPTDTTLIYYNKALEIALKYQYRDLEFTAINNTGVNYQLRGDIDKAREYYIKSAEIMETLPDEKYGLCFSLLNIGHTYRKQNRWKEAEPWYDKALPVCQSCGNTEGEASIYIGLKEMYIARGDYKQAMYYQQLQFKTDSLHLSQQYSRANLELETIYKTAQKEKEINREKEKRNRLLFLSGGLLLLAATVFYIFRNRQLLKQKRAKLLAEVEHAEAEKLRHLDKMKNSFFANISHEFRTPLTLMIGPLKQMEQGKLDEDSSKKYMKMMRHNGERLLHLVNQMLDLSKLESGKLGLQVSKTDISGLIKATVYSFNSMAEQKQVNYHTHFPEHEIIGWIDRDKFQKIVTNLLSNAFKFTPENGSVSVDVENGDKRIRITVGDSGPGIPKEQLDKIFDRFYQVEGTEGGTGIGLSLVKELVQLHKGQISVSSDTGRGASFRFSIPVAREFYSDDDVEISGKETSAISTVPASGYAEEQVKEVIGDSSLPTVLIVEDNTDLQQFISDTLKKEFNVTLAGNGKDGIEKAVQLIPDLIVTDVMMPVVDGVVMTNEIKKNEKTSHIPVIMLTAKATAESKIEGLKTGADDYLVKPFDGDELIARIQNLIEQRRKLRELYSKKIISITPDKVELQSQENIFLEKIRAAIDENLDNEMFGVVNLANAANMSRSQLHRKLKALTGEAPNELIRNFRLERAMDLLQKNAGNITEVAFMTGFSSPAYFSKCFNDRYGFSPTEVKKQGV